MHLLYSVSLDLYIAHRSIFTPTHHNFTLCCVHSQPSPQANCKNNHYSKILNTRSSAKKHRQQSYHTLLPNITFATPKTPFIKICNNHGDIPHFCLNIKLRSCRTKLLSNKLSINHVLKVAESGFCLLKLVFLDNSLKLGNCTLFAFSNVVITLIVFYAPLLIALKLI